MPKINQWSLKYKSCTRCGTVDKPHDGRGLCKNCYRKYYRKTPAGRAERKRYQQKYIQTENGKNYHYNQKLREYGFGGTLKLKHELLDQQDWKCAVCQKKLPEGIRESHFDHNHKNNTPRGILCQYCNHGLGNFRDNIQYLQKAIDYLEKYN